MINQLKDRTDKAVSIETLRVNLIRKGIFSHGDRINTTALLSPLQDTCKQCGQFIQVFFCICKYFGGVIISLTARSVVFLCGYKSVHGDR